MLKIRQVIFLSLTLLPLLIGVLHNISSCCDIIDSVSVSRIDNTTSETSHDDCNTENNCFDCCGFSHSKIYTTSITTNLIVTSSLVHTSYDYSFSKISNFQSTPDKPPRA
jgi:hypothetical protein